MEADNRNFPALLQLLQTYMANPVKNEDAIKEIFERDEKDFSDERVASFYVQKGFFACMRKEFEEALQFWATAYEKNSACMEADLQVGKIE